MFVCEECSLHLNSTANFCTKNSIHLFIYLPQNEKSEKNKGLLIISKTILINISNIFRVQWLIFGRLLCFYIYIFFKLSQSLHSGHAGAPTKTSSQTNDIVLIFKPGINLLVPNMPTPLLSNAGESNTYTKTYIQIYISIYLSEGFFRFLSSDPFTRLYRPESMIVDTCPKFHAVELCLKRVKKIIIY